MIEVDADIWVLTETHVDHSPGDDYRGVHTPAVPARRPFDERWVGIWSRHPIEPLTEPTAHGRGTIAAVVAAPLGHVVVFGCVIAWANEPHLDNGSPAKMWQAHMEVIDRIDHDIELIRTRHPDLPIVMAGDFNQDRDGSGWYGTYEVRRRLGDVLERHDLDCVTALDVVAAGLLENRHLVDHICVEKSLAGAASVRCWDTVDDSGVRLSEHPTVAVDIATAGSRPPPTPRSGLPGLEQENRGA
jgi:endonuclease/exonuclease/phosphatase family metal-dependent hydrolase